MKSAAIASLAFLLFGSSAFASYVNFINECDKQWNCNVGTDTFTVKTDKRHDGTFGHGTGQKCKDLCTCTYDEADTPRVFSVGNNSLTGNVAWTNPSDPISHDTAFNYNDITVPDFPGYDSLLLTGQGKDGKRGVLMLRLSCGAE